MRRQKPHTGTLGAIRSDPIARVAALRASGETVYWLAASNRELAALLQGTIRTGLRDQARRLLDIDEPELEG